MKKLGLLIITILIMSISSKSQTLELWGISRAGGGSGEGNVFTYNPVTNTTTNKVNFDGALKGSFPAGSLMQASNNKIYGLTANGGANNFGVLFEYDIAISTYTKLLDFDGAAKGKLPVGDLMQASNGKIYGGTTSGGVNDLGVLFEYDPATGIYTNIFDFDGGVSGAGFAGDLVEISSGKLYGVTVNGGGYNNGVIFEYDISTSTYTKKQDFQNTPKGAYPYGGLIKSTNGKLYGGTTGGGTNNFGVLFEYDPVGDVYAKLLDFDGATKGKFVYGRLLEVSNNVLYGMTEQGGANNLGVIFEYDILTSTYTKKLDFDGTSKGSKPQGKLMLSSNGKLYGMTARGGSSTIGVIFEYDFSTPFYTKKIDFSGVNGNAPQGYFIEINTCYSSSNTINETICSNNTYTSPSGKIWNTANTYLDTISNACGNDSLLTINLTVTTVDTSVTQTGTDLSANELVATYQWLDCNNNYAIIPSATFRTYYATSNGSYAVAVTSFGCTDTSSCHVISSVGIAENNISQSITLYPNPVKNQLKITSGKVKIERIEVLDVTGRKIKTSVSNFKTINVSGLNKGVYFIQIYTEKGLGVKRFIKE